MGGRDTTPEKGDFYERTGSKHTRFSSQKDLKGLEWSVLQQRAVCERTPGPSYPRNPAGDLSTWSCWSLINLKGSGCRVHGLPMRHP